MPLVKLVMQYESGGGYDCNSCTTTRVFEYDSEEALLCDFEDKLKKQLEIRNEYCKKNTLEYRDVNSFMFQGYEFELYDFVYESHLELPEIFTLEDWFLHKLSEKEKENVS